MKQLSLWMLVFMLTAILVGCAAGRYPYNTSNLADETWRSQMKVYSAQWVTDADSWFRASTATETVYRNQYAPYDEAISTEMVRVPNFQNIKIQGNFKVQITGACKSTTVKIEGPNPAVRSIAVMVRNDTLILIQTKNAPINMDRVIVHIAMKNINSLSFAGAGRVEGVHLFSDHFSVESNAVGNMYLAGHLNVKCVVARNCGSVTIFTVNTSQTEILSTGAGNVNIKAQCHVGLRSIKHYGTGDINIIRAAGNDVSIDANNIGKIIIIGCIGVKQIRAAGHVCVFISDSNSTAPCIYVYDDARVGIAGRAGTLYAYATRTARLLGGSLSVDKLYLESSGASHMNVRATERAFATARDYSTIYYYGNPNVMEAYQKNNSSVIDMNVWMAPTPAVPERQVNYVSTSSTVAPLPLGAYEQIYPRRNVDAYYMR